jgi:3-mercaptopyruvate sulfurtransferase SseA
MVKNAAGFLSFLMLVVLALGSSGSAAPANKTPGEVPRMEVDELNARLGDSSLVVIDVRTAADWEGSSVKIKGAVREAGKSVSDWASNYSKDKTIVLYCA